MNETTKVLISKSTMDAIGDSIRLMKSEETKYLPSEMPAAIEAIPNRYTASDEGKVVINGALMAQTARTPTITENGEYDTTGNNRVTVNVQGGGGSSGPLTYLTPYAENITTGWVGYGNWTYSGEYQNLNTTMFAVEANHTYLFMNGEAHERFRAMFTTVDISQATNDVSGSAIVNMDSPSALACVSYTPTQNGYVAVYVGHQPNKAYGFEGTLP